MRFIHAEPESPETGSAGVPVSNVNDGGLLRRLECLTDMATIDCFERTLVLADSRVRSTIGTLATLITRRMARTFGGVDRAIGFSPETDRAAIDRLRLGIAAAERYLSRLRSQLKLARSRLALQDAIGVVGLPPDGPAGRGLETDEVLERIDSLLGGLCPSAVSVPGRIARAADGTIPQHEFAAARVASRADDVALASKL